MDWNYIIFGIAVVLMIILIIILVIGIVLRKKKIALHYDTAYGEVAAYGEKRDYVIEVDHRYLFMVHKGEIVSYQDKEKNNHMTYYVGGDITC